MGNDTEDEDKKIMKSFLDSLKSEHDVEVDEMDFFQEGDDRSYHVYVNDRQNNILFEHFYASIARRFASNTFMYIEVEFLECEYTEGGEREIDAMYAKWLKEDMADFKKAFPKTTRRFGETLKFALAEH